MARGKREYTAAKHASPQRLGAWVRALCGAAGLNQHDFADAAHLDRSTISPLERGRFDVRLSTVLRVAGTLGIRADELLRQVLDEQGAE